MSELRLAGLVITIIVGGIIAEICNKTVKTRLLNCGHWRDVLKEDKSAPIA